MLRDIVEAQPIEPYCLHLRYEDGVEGVVDLEQMIDFSGIFAPLQDPAYFAQVQIHPELGTLVWSNGADLDPDVLYAIVSGKPIPNYEVSTLHRS
ncbi:MAG: DUF2442 domain-containing protein [Leptolyngbya sp. BL-A-14]